MAKMEITTADDKVVMVPRAGVGELIGRYADGLLDFAGLQREIAALGYATTSTFEMVRHIEPKKTAAQRCNRRT